MKLVNKNIIFIYYYLLKLLLDADKNKQYTIHKISKTEIISLK